MTDHVERTQLLAKIHELEETEDQILLSLIADMLAKEVLPQLAKRTDDFLEQEFDLAGRVTMQGLTEMINQTEAWKLLYVSMMKLRTEVDLASLLLDR